MTWQGYGHPSLQSVQGAGFELWGLVLKVAGLNQSGQRPGSSPLLLFQLLLRIL